MADEEDKTIIENGKTESTEEDSPPAKAEGKKKLILFGGIGLGAIVIGVALAFFVVKPMMSSEKAELDEDSTEQVDKSEKKKEDKEHKSKPKKKKKKRKSGEKGASESVVYLVRDIVINPAGTGGTRFLSVSFGFELESAEIAAEFEAREPIIRDALITVLASKTVAQLTDPKQKEIIRYQIKKRISKIMNTNELAGVYYTDFVLQ